MKINTLRFIPFLAAFLYLPFATNAQCDWRLVLKDSGGNGWGGSFLLVGTNVNTFFYDLNGFNDNGSDTTIYLTLAPGENLFLNWFSGSANPEEISVELYDGSNVSVLNVVDPADGTLYETVVSCPACALPTDVVEENIYDKRVKLKWALGNGAATAVGWWVIYGPDGFTPAPGIGDTVYVTAPKVTITGLTPKTPYTYYVIQDCGNGETSGQSGPHDFTTYWSNDVSVTGVLTPKNDCDLQAETITFAMSNPGSNPQSLIPYNFSVNGVAGGVPQPDDGYYTGVIGKDSTEVIEFETSFNFSDKIEYEIAVFTEMPGDEDVSNDTFYYYVNNILAPPYAQTFEKWNGGWTVVSDPASFNPASWEYGTPNAPIITSAGEGQKAWVTNLDGTANWGETSYIQSTCFDFSEITAPPAVSFLINYSATSGTDGSFLEYSKDDGATWVRVGTSPNTGANWYNAPDPVTGLQLRSWSGNSDGWRRAHHLITGLNGLSNVIFRFGYVSSFGVTQEGVGIDDFKVFVPVSTDLAAVKGRTLGETTLCGQINDKFVLTAANLGGSSIPSGYKLFYSVNGGAPDSVQISNNTLIPDENVNGNFTQTFDSRDALITIKAWVVANGDLLPTNDTITYVIDHRPAELPLFEDFEAAEEIPTGWTTTPTVNVSDAHGNVSNVIFSNLYSFNPTFRIELPRHGVVDATDLIRFDYRIVDYSGINVPTILGTTDKIEVKVSSDCGSTFQTIGTINSTNHVVSNQMASVSLPLSAFVNESIIIAFEGTWGAGDYYVDIDNINIVACGSSMDLSAEIKPTAPTASNGAATVNVGNGNPPYTYNWSNGQTTQTATGLGAGSYTVTVLDANSCSDTLTVEVLVNGINDVTGITQFTVRPNPTTGLLFMDVRLDKDMALQAEMVNLLGQQVWSAQPGETSAMSEVINMSDMPVGIYMLRVVANGQVSTKKVILTR